MDWGKPFAVNFRAVYVDRLSREETGTVAGLLPGGSVSRNLDTNSKESGKISVTGEFEPGGRLVRLYADVSQGGELTAECLGTFVPNVSGYSYDGAVRTYEVELDGMLSELLDDVPDYPLTFPAGTPAVSAAREIAESAGFAVYADDSAYVLGASRTYGLDEDENKLSIVNDLLGLAGFSSASCDAMGNLLMRRYVRPSARPVVATMAEGPGCTFERACELKRDIGEVKNVVRCVYETQDETVIGVATDDLPTSEYSTVSLGRRNVGTYRYSDSATQAQADARAAEILAGMRDVVTSVTVTHVYRPIELSDVVALDYPSAGVSGRFTVRIQDISMGDAMPVECELRSFAGSAG